MALCYKKRPSQASAYASCTPLGRQPALIVELEPIRQAHLSLPPSEQVFSRGRLHLNRACEGFLKGYRRGESRSAGRGPSAARMPKANVYLPPLGAWYFHPLPPTRRSSLFIMSVTPSVLRWGSCVSQSGERRHERQTIRWRRRCPSRKAGPTAPAPAPSVMPLRYLAELHGSPARPRADTDPPGRPCE